MRALKVVLSLVLTLPFFIPFPSAQAFDKTSPLTTITLKVGSPAVLSLQPTLEVLEAYDSSRQPFAEWIKLNQTSAVVEDFYLRVTDVLAQGAITLPLQNLNGTPLKVLGFGLSSSFDVYKGGDGYIYFKTYANGCRKINFTAKRDSKGAFYLWKDGKAISNLSITTTVTHISVQAASINTWNGSTQSPAVPLDLGALPISICP